MTDATTEPDDLDDEADDAYPTSDDGFEVAVSLKTALQKTGADLTISSLTDGSWQNVLEVELDDWDKESLARWYLERQAATRFLTDGERDELVLAALVDVAGDPDFPTAEVIAAADAARQVAVREMIKNETAGMFGNRDPETGAKL
ncbi:hypothetical protein [Rathayibacter agropyri]|uniref:hypothetical protein n=1 Tax=Rathayibacter agropyri TaxID=1634927 RepID=UPI001564D668|nr:hypothetical protein [Rathayibacter agropyri]NRD08413.1 hypothetical protein [Rathayibacter agropyri]